MKEYGHVEIGFFGDGITKEVFKKIVALNEKIAKEEGIVFRITSPNEPQAYSDCDEE